MEPVFLDGELAIEEFSYVICDALSPFPRHTKQFVGLEPTQSQKDHWDAVQCSIVVQKLQETVRESSSKQSLTNYPSQSLVEAILPHESSE